MRYAATLSNTSNVISTALNYPLRSLCRRSNLCMIWHMAKLGGFALNPDFSCRLTREAR